jgi:hypothetical protein
MRSMSLFFCFWATLCVGAAHGEGQDEPAYEFRRIKSLDEIQGHWAFVPKGERGLGGQILEISGRKATLKSVADVEPPGTKNTGVSAVVVDGALILKEDSRDVLRQKWQLAQFGKYKCLVRMFADDRLRGQPRFRVDVLYLHEPDQKKGDAEGD